MKRLIITAAIFLGFSAASFAQETYSISANANQVTRLTRALLVNDALACFRAGQAATCTQAQACTPSTLGCAGGASCTAAQARACGQRIYPNTQPGREEFLTFALVARDVSDLLNNAVSFDQTQFCVAFKAASNAAQNNACTAIGYTPVSGQCEICP